MLKGSLTLSASWLRHVLGVVVVRLRGLRRLRGTPGGKVQRMYGFFPVGPNRPPKSENPQVSDLRVFSCRLGATYLRPQKPIHSLHF